MWSCSIVNSWAISSAVASDYGAMMPLPIGWRSSLRVSQIRSKPPVQSFTGNASRLRAHAACRAFGGRRWPS